MKPFFAFLLGTLISCYIMWCAVLILQNKDYARDVYMPDGTRCVAYSVYRSATPWEMKPDIAVACNWESYEVKNQVERD